MATLKYLVLPHHKKADGSYNVKIRVTQRGQSRYIKTEQYVTSSDISKRKEAGKEKIRIKNQAVICLLDDLLQMLRKRLLDVGVVADQWSVDEVVEYLTEADGGEFRLNFIDYGLRLADKIEAEGRRGTARMYRATINSLKRFRGSDYLDINSITTSFLHSYEDFLKQEPRHIWTPGKGVVVNDGIKKGNTACNYIVLIRAIHNIAKLEFNDEDKGIIRIPLSPFARYKTPSPTLTRHRVLTIEQMQKIIDLPYKKGLSSYNRAKDCFLMSFAMMGINVADMYEVSDFNDDILTYCRRKTRGRRQDNALLKVRIEPEIRKIFDKYRTDSGKPVFRFSRTVSDAQTLTTSINMRLHEIGESIGVPELSFYYARHTFATLAANKAKVDIYTVDEMLNHSDGKMKLARVYIERDFSLLWEANRKVIELLDWSSVM
jgi:integrase